MTLSIIENLRTIRTRLTKATSSVAGDVQALRDQIREKREAVKNLTKATAPRSDLEQRIRDLVAKTGDGWVTREGWSVLSHLGNPARRASVPWDAGKPMPWDVLCAANPEAAVGLLIDLANRIEYTAGPPLAERPAMIAKLEAEIAQIEEGEERLVDEAAAAGLVIAHRPEVQQRKQNEARKAELDRQAVVDRAAREAALNEAHASRTRRTGGSNYLASGGQA
jgi:hypothetical protein